MKRQQKLWIFAVFVALVVGYSIWDYKSTQNAEKVKDEKSLLLPYNGAHVSGFHIQSKETDFELKREKDGWKVVKPITELADQNAATQFVEGLSTEKATETAVEGDKIDFSAFGLDQPKGAITVLDNEGKPLKFTVGSRKNFQGDAFLRLNDEKKVVIASSTWFAKVEKKLLDFRDKRLMKISNAKTEKVSFEQGREKFQIVKKDDNWILPNHPDWKLDQNKVREILAMLNNTEALEIIVDGNPSAQEMKAWGFAKPKMKIQVQIKDEKDWWTEIAATSDNVHRARTSEPVQVLKISPSDAERFFLITEDSLRDRSEPFNFDKAQVKEVEFKVGKRHETWKADDEKARQLLSRLRSLAAVNLQEPKAAKLEDEIILKGETGEIFRMQWGNPHSIEYKGAESSVYSAKTSLYPQTITILESDISGLKLTEPQKENPSGNTKEKQK